MRPRLLIQHIVLCLSQRFNTMSWALSDDLRQANAYLRKRRHLQALTLRANGSTFCAGGNPFAAKVNMSLAAHCQVWYEVSHPFVELRELSVPTTAALHGRMIGGASALFLQTDVRLTDRESTFQHLPPYVYE